MSLNLESRINAIDSTYHIVFPRNKNKRRKRREEFFSKSPFILEKSNDEDFEIYYSNLTFYDRTAYYIKKELQLKELNQEISEFLGRKCYKMIYR